MNNATQQFIEDALKGNYKNESLVKTASHIDDIDPTKCYDVLFALLDPLAWQAVGKTRRWGRFASPYNDPKHYWHRFIDHLADGKNIEESLQALN